METVTRHYTSPDGPLGVIAAWYFQKNRRVFSAYLESRRKLPQFRRSLLTSIVQLFQSPSIDAVRAIPASHLFAHHRLFAPTYSASVLRLSRRSPGPLTRPPPQSLPSDVS